MTKLFTILFFLTISTFIQAQETKPELIGDRPDMTESAYIIAKKHLQIETGFDFSKESSLSSTYTYNSTLIRYGLFESAELRLGVESANTIFNEVSSKSLPLYVGTKIHILDKDKNYTQIALIVASGIEWLDTGLGNLVFDFTPNAIFTFENNITDNISLGYNLGLEYSTLSREITGIISAALGIGLGDKNGAFAELAWFPTDLSNDVRLNTGFTHLFSDNIQMDIYGGLGLTPDSPVFNVGAGLIFLF